MTNAVTLTVQMIERRDDMRRLLGDRYAREIAGARAVLRGVANSERIGIAAAALKIAQGMAAAGVDPGLMIAALVDEAQERGDAEPEASCG